MSYNIKLLLPPIFNRVMLNVDEHVFTLRSQKKRKLDNSLVFYWECRKKCGVIFLTTIVNGEHVKDKYFIQTDEHSHVPELLIENGYERLFKKCISNSCVEEHQSNSYQRNLYYYNAQHTGSTSTENAPSPLTDHLLHSQTYFNFQDFPAEFQNTLSGHKFYVKDIGREDSRIIIFSTIENLEYLSQSRYWLASGTHDSDLSSLKSFKHIYTIHGDIKIGNDIICVPLVFSLMAYPTINTYRTMFSELKSFAFEHDIYFEENTHLQIVTDLNIFAINALFNVFPFATHSIGFFHFSQNIYQQIHSERLAYKYNSNAVFNLLCRQISALAFLPASKVLAYKFQFIAPVKLIRYPIYLIGLCFIIFVNCFTRLSKVGIKLNRFFQITATNKVYCPTSSRLSYRKERV